MGRRKQFVTAASWNEVKRGKYYASKETKLKYKGSRHKGRVPHSRREGVLDLECYEDTAVAEKTVEHGLEFRAHVCQAFERKMDALQAAFGSQARFREDANAVKGPGLSMDSLLAPSLCLRQCN